MPRLSWIAREIVVRNSVFARASDRQHGGRTWRRLSNVGLVPGRIDDESVNEFDQVLTMLGLAFESILFNEMRTTGRTDAAEPPDLDGMTDALDDFALARWAERHDLPPLELPASRWS